MRLSLILVLAGLSFVGVAHANECDSVLRDGTLTKTQIQTSSYLKLVYVARLSRMTYSEAKSKTSLDGTIPIEGVPLQIGFGNDEFEQFKEWVQSSIDIEQVSKYEHSVQTSSGDPVIVAAWESCMARNGGLDVRIEPRGDKQASVKVKWWPTAGSGGKSPKVEEFYVSSGARVVGGAKWTRAGQSLGVGSTRIITIERNPATDVLVTMSTDFTDESAFLPKPLPPAPPALPKEIRVGSCVGKGGVLGVRFWGPPDADCNGIPPWGPYFEFQQKVDQLSSCKGRGGVEGVRLWGPPNGTCASIPEWGKYTNPVSVSSSKRLCACLGHGNVLEGQLLWGPEGEICGGIPSWGEYNQHCRSPQ